MSKYVCDTCGDVQFIHEPITRTACLRSDCGGNYVKAEFARPADAIQVGGDYYKTLAIQPWDVMKAWATKKEFAAYLWLTSIKYLARWQKKNGVEDLRKARHYLDKLIEELEE